MNRRGCIQTLGALFGAALAAPRLLLPPDPYSWFDPAMRYGSYYATTEISPEIIQRLVDEVRAVLPPGTVFGVLTIEPTADTADPLEQCGYVAWIYPVSAKSQLRFVA